MSKSEEMCSFWQGDLRIKVQYLQERKSRGTEQLRIKENSDHKSKFYKLWLK